MTRELFFEKWGPALVVQWDQFNKDLDELIKEAARNAVRNAEHQKYKTEYQKFIDR